MAIGSFYSGRREAHGAFVRAAMAMETAMSAMDFKDILVIGADFTLMGWLLRICPLDRLNIALCKQTEALSNRCASLAATDCIELAVLLQACNRLH